MGVNPVGVAAHADAVSRLKRSYDALDPTAPIRLSKRTSNLFRQRVVASTPGLDVSGLDGVISIDPAARTVDVQGMCTYEDLVAATLPHGLIPLVVPQLKTITLGGAVTGLGIESTSFRNGLPHESVVEMEIFTGAVEVVIATPHNEHADLFAAFPNSYGSLGYATRLRIELEAVPGFVELTHVRFDSLEAAAKAIDVISESREWSGMDVDAVDGTAFSPDEVYLSLATFTDRQQRTSDYTGQHIYYRSIQHRHRDALTMHDYLWRWDTDWFWCSAAFGAQNAYLRRLWPKRFRRSDVYHRLIGLDTRWGLSARLDKLRKVPGRERVIQDIEVPAPRLAEFGHWFDDHVGMRPLWLCPLRLRGDRVWPLYPLSPHTTYVNVGFWGTVQVPAGSLDGMLNRKIERKVTELGGHKSLYSDAFFDRETFDSIYGSETLDPLRKRYDPSGRLSGLYEKAVIQR